MPLLASALLTPNFTAGELGADHPAASPTVVTNLRRVAEWLQAVRDLLGVPIRVTSGYRTVVHNSEVGGSATSDHVTGLAADFVVDGLSPFAVYQALNKAQEARQLPAFDQLVYYALDNHVHVGLGPRTRGEVLLKTAEGSYVQLAGAYVTKIRGYL